MKTNFIHEKITFNIDDEYGQSQTLAFVFDGNSKITASNGTFDNPKPNAFSTVQISDCPGSTPSCRKACYVHGLEKYAPDVHNAYKHNSINIRRVLLDENNSAILSDKFARWIKANCNEFRWHVSGDIFSREYAQFIKHVAIKTPDVLFWIYTRTFDFVEELNGAGNLVVNLSADIDNDYEAFNYADEYNLRVCYFSNTGEIPLRLRDNDVIFPNYSLRGREMDNPEDHKWWKELTERQKKMVCPVDFYGQSEKRRCGKCKRCMKHYKK